MSTSTLGGHVNTISKQMADGRRRRRIHSDEFKANAVAAYMQPGMAMAAVAMANGVNANLLRRWVREAELRPGADRPAAPLTSITPPSGGLQRSSIDLEPRVPTHASHSHARSAIAACFGAGRAMSLGWR